MKISGRHLWPPQLYSSVSWLGLLSLVNYQTCNYPVTKIPQNHVCFLSVLVLVILLWRHLLFDHKHCRVQQKLEWKVKQSFVRLMLFCIFLLIHVYSSSFLFFFYQVWQEEACFHFPCRSTPQHAQPVLLSVLAGLLHHLHLCGSFSNLSVHQRICFGLVLCS